MCVCEDSSVLNYGCIAVERVFWLKGGRENSTAIIRVGGYEGGDGTELSKRQRSAELAPR